MRRLILGFRAFFAVLFSAEVAERVRPALEDGEADAPAPANIEPAKPPEPAKPVPPPPSHEALMLLAALQREARLVDFVREPIDAYTDEQVGAAVREIHRESRKVLDRVFGLAPVREEEEGAEVELPAGYDASRYRLSGEVAEGAAVRGRLVHHGWVATGCNLPSFTGDEEVARVIAPAEIEVV